MPDALQVLRADHDKVKDIFKQFENSEDRNQKKMLAEQALMELEVHALIEEEIFYPAMRKQLGEQELLHEAEEEHHVAELIMEELKKTRATAKNFDAKFMVLAENVKHHIQEEEGQMFPKAAEAGRAQLDRLGEQLMERKQELMQEMQGGGRRASSAKRGRTTSRNGRGRTTRTTARSRSTGRTRTGASRVRSGSSSRSTSGTRSRASASRSGSSSSRSRSSTKRSTTKRGGTRGRR